jgi:hypothetical protein
MMDEKAHIYTVKEFEVGPERGPEQADMVKDSFSAPDIHKRIMKPCKRGL